MAMYPRTKLQGGNVTGAQLQGSKEAMPNKNKNTLPQPKAKIYPRKSKAAPKVQNPSFISSNRQFYGPPFGQKNK